MTVVLKLCTKYRDAYKFDKFMKHVTIACMNFQFKNETFIIFIIIHICKTFSVIVLYYNIYL